jgi:hypothetical protein
MVGIALYLSGGELIAGAWVAFAGHIPIMIIEGFVCAAAVALIRQVRPELFSQVVPSRTRFGPRGIWAANTAIIGLVAGVPLGYAFLPSGLRPGAVLDGHEITLGDVFVDEIVATETGPYFLAAAIGGAIVFAVIGYLLGPWIQRLLTRREVATAVAAAADAAGREPRP